MHYRLGSAQAGGEEIRGARESVFVERESERELQNSVSSLWAFGTEKDWVLVLLLALFRPLSLRFSGALSSRECRGVRESVLAERESGSCSRSAIRVLVILASFTGSRFVGEWEKVRVPGHKGRILSLAPSLQSPQLEG